MVLPFPLFSEFAVTPVFFGFQRGSRRSERFCYSLGRVCVCSLRLCRSICGKVPLFRKAREIDRGYAAGGGAARDLTRAGEAELHRK